MNRRDCLKSIAGALLLPAIKLDMTHDRDLSMLVGEFCEPRKISARYDLSRPCEFEQAAVACDSKALLSVPDLRYATTGAGVKVPPFDDVFRQFWRDDDKWLRLPVERLATSDSARSYCPDCERDMGCDYCDGVGELHSIQDHMHMCHRCQGYGYIARHDCPICRGQYRDLPWLDGSLGQLISRRYSRLVRQIPGVRYRPPAVEDGPVLFRGDGGIRAMVMGVW